MDFVRVKPVIYNTPCSDKMQEKKDKDGRKLQIRMGASLAPLQ